MRPQIFWQNFAEKPKTMKSQNLNKPVLQKNFPKKG